MPSSIGGCGIGERRVTPDFGEGGQMNGTVFPARPSDVAALTVQEFTFDLETNHDPSIDVVCRTFAHDQNRALVWLIRFRALNALWARPDIAEWRRASASTSREICEVAARFDLDDRWEFDPERFCAAVDVVVCRRSPA
jgi:hypothetical protein